MLDVHPGILLRLRTFQVVSHNESWPDHGKHAAQMQANLMMMMLSQPLFWPAIHPSYMSSPLFMHCGGHNIDLASSCHKQMYDCMSRVKTVAADPVASAMFCHGTEQAVFNCLSKVGAADGDGGAFGKVQAYIGLDRGEIMAYTAGPSVSVSIWLQQPRAAEIRPRDKPEEIVDLARCFCYIAPVSFRMTNASFPTRGYCSLNMVVMRLATGVSAATYLEGMYG